MKMLEKVQIVIIERNAETEARKARLQTRLRKEGLEVNVAEAEEPEAEKTGTDVPAAGELYLTDCPELARRLGGGNCRILLYLTEKSRALPMAEYPYAVEELEDLDAEYLEGIYRRLAGEPWEILRTERLIVREQREEDLDSLYEIYAHPDMTAYMEGLAEDREEERERLQSYIRTVYPLYGFGLWMLETGENSRDETGKDSSPETAGKCIGRAGFFWREGAELPELGFAIKKSEQGKGFCLEACRAILEYGFRKLEFSGVQALTRDGNRAAEAVLIRLGFRRDGFIQAEGKRAARWFLRHPFSERRASGSPGLSAGLLLLGFP